MVAVCVHVQAARLYAGLLEFGYFAAALVSNSRVDDCTNLRSRFQSRIPERSQVSVLRPAMAAFGVCCNNKLVVFCTSNESLHAARGKVLSGRLCVSAIQHPP